MGRPIFSQQFSSATPAVRVEPDDGGAIVTAQQPVCERWSYWKPFDPDSDDFFNNGVYEAFVELAADRDSAPSPIVEDSSSSGSDSSSSGSSEDGGTSGRGTPVGDGRRQEEEDIYGRIGIRARDDSENRLTPLIGRVNETSEGILRRELRQTATGPLSSIPIVPIPIPVNRDHRVYPSSPVTPPSASNTFQVTPTSGSDATPRLYSWRDLSSPTRVNTSMRRSYPHAHVPSYIRVHDIAF